MTAKEMARELAVSAKDAKAFGQLIRELILAGELVEVKKKRLADPARVDLLVGALECNPRGFGFVRPVREIDGDDIYVAAANMNSAMHDDIVVVRIPSDRKAKRTRSGRRPGAKSDAKIVEVLKRARTEIVGTFRLDNRVGYVVPDNPRLFRNVIVAAGDAGDARNDDKVAVRISVWPTLQLPPEGEVTQVFGPRGKLDAEMQSVVHEFDLRREFDAKTLRHARRIPSEPSAADLKGRIDLTGEMIFTILTTRST